MKRIVLWIGLLMILATLPAGAAESSTSKSASPMFTATNVPSRQVIAFYFHGTVRCETCLKIEQQAKALIERQFKTELDTQRLVFRPLNYDLPENAHYLQDYKLPCPSLVLVRQEFGKDLKWKMLGQIWTLVETSTAFDQYVGKEVDNYLSDSNNLTDETGATKALSNDLISEFTPGKAVGSLAELNVLLGDINAAFVFVHATNGPSLINKLGADKSCQAGNGIRMGDHFGLI